jgi:hypothetical protein
MQGHLNSLCQHPSATNASFNESSKSSSLQYSNVSTSQPLMSALISLKCQFPLGNIARTTYCPVPEPLSLKGIHPWTLHISTIKPSILVSCLHSTANYANIPLLGLSEFLSKQCQLSSATSGNKHLQTILAQFNLDCKHLSVTFVSFPQTPVF